MESPLAYIPIDRAHAMAAGRDLPRDTEGAALFADISGFTPLTEALVRVLGRQRGAEELPRQLNLIYDALIAQVERFGGSVIGFSGDAITCWFDADDGPRATACALRMQQAMTRFAAVPIPGSDAVSLAIKVAVACGSARRFLVGDPAIQLVDVLAGATLERLAAAEHLAQKGEVVLDPRAAAALDARVDVVEWRVDHEAGGTHDAHFAVVGGLRAPVASAPWPALPSDALSEDQMRPWLLPPVYERLSRGLGEFLTELRPATSLFLRFSGINYDDDPAAGDKLDAFICWVQSILQRFGGSLIQLTLGDKGSYLYAAFGAPLAHDGDTRRAVLTALEILAPPPHLAFVRDLQIGISHGSMRTGAYGSDSRRTYGVLGDETNMAARLMQNAPRGTILVSAAAQRLVMEAFEWQELAPLRVKGKSEPVVVYRPLGVRQGSTGLAWRMALPLIGREAELGLIAKKLEQALEGRGQIVGVMAEAGMGKSRLVAEAVRLVRERGLTSYEGACQSYGTNDSYLVWEPICRALFGMEGEGELEERQRRLERELEAIDPLLVARVPLLGVVLNLPLAETSLTASLDAKLRKASLEALLVDCVRARARREPLVLVLEDCHWLDRLSYDLLEALGRAIAEEPVLIVVAYRPPTMEYTRPLSVTQLPYSTVLELRELGPAEAERLIEQKLARLGEGIGELPVVLRARIMERAGGNPFFIEELLNYLHDQGLELREAESLELPTTVQSLVLSRIDRLGERQKLTLKVASVIGREFSFGWLWGVHPELGEARQVQGELEYLSDLDLTALERDEPELVYLFKHITTRDVAYESLPFAARGELHGQLAGYIERRHAGAAEQYLDLLAYHYDLSSKEGKKREYLRRAGEAAQAAFANAAAIDYYRRLLRRLEEGEQGEVLLRLGRVLDLVGEWTEAGTLFEQTIALAEQQDDIALLARSQHALGWLLRKQGDYSGAQQRLGQARAGFEQLDDSAGMSRVLADIGEVYRAHGEFGQAQVCYDESLAFADVVTIPAVRLDVRANTLKCAGTLANQQGDSQRARTLYEESLTVRRELDDRPGVAAMLSNLGIVTRHQQDYATAWSLNDESLAIFRALGDRWSQGKLLNNQGCVAADLRDFRAARALLEESLILHRQLGDRAGVLISLTSLADVVLDVGDYEAASPLLEESLPLSHEMGDRVYAAYLLNDYAVLAAGQGRAARALRLAGAAAAERAALGASLSPGEQERFDRLMAPARATLDEVAAADAWSAGQALPLDQAIAFALTSDAGSATA